MRDLFVTPALQFLFPIFLVGLLIFVISTPMEDLLSFAAMILPDQEYITHLNWKVYR
jgi:hypothetical protein